MFTSVHVEIISDLIIKFAQKWNISIEDSFNICFYDGMRFLLVPEGIAEGEDDLMYNVESFYCIRPGFPNSILKLSVTNNITLRVKEVSGYSINGVFKSLKNDIVNSICAFIFDESSSNVNPYDRFKLVKFHLDKLLCLQNKLLVDEYLSKLEVISDSFVLEVAADSFDVLDKPQTSTRPSYINAITIARKSKRNRIKPLGIFDTNSRVTCRVAKVDNPRAIVYTVNSGGRHLVACKAIPASLVVKKRKRKSNKLHGSKIY